MSKTTDSTSNDPQSSTLRNQADTARERIIVSREFGFFSNLYSVIGALDWCEQTGEIPVIQFDSGVYLDKDRGPNWWEYFFELTPHLRGSHGTLVNRDKDSDFASKIALRTIPDRHRTAELIQKYIKLNPEIARSVDDFWDEHIDYFIVGLHIRGTDKVNEVPPLGVQEIIATVEKITKGRENGTWKLFVATDESRLLKVITKTFGNHVIFQPAIRSENAQPIHAEGAMAESSHVEKQYGYRLGLEALRDMIFLSRCDVFVGCQSNLSFFAAAWNPSTPWVNLSPSSLIINSKVHEDLVAKEEVIQELAKENKRLSSPGIISKLNADLVAKEVVIQKLVAENKRLRSKE